MNKSKDPGIITESILLVDVVFNRYLVPPQDMQVQINMSYNGSCSSEEYAHGTLKAKVKGTKKSDSIETEVFAAEITFAGIFRKDMDNPNLDLEVFINNHAPAHIFPYVREFLTSLSHRSGLPTIILPPLNMAALLQLDMKADLTDSSIEAKIQ